VETVQAKLTIKVAKSKDKNEKDEKNEENEKDKEIFILKRINIRSQIRINRYYIAEEIEGLDININDIDEEVDNKPSNYDFSDNDNKFNDTLEGDQDAADKNIK
jgi:hypothetical protein